MLFRAALLLSALTLGQAVAGEIYVPQASTQRVLRNLDRLSGETERDRIAKAVEVLTELAENESKPDIDRSMAYELRARFQYALDGDPSAYADDMILSLQFSPDDDYRRYKLVEQIAQALIVANRLDEALAFIEQYGDDFFRGREEANFLRAEIYASRGELGKAISAIGTENQPNDSLEEKKLRYALLLTTGRFAEARLVLEGFGTDIFYADAVAAELRRVAELEQSGASERERRDTAVAFTDRLDALRQEAEPIIRQPPTGFERCLRSGYEGEVRVRLRFDVTEEGRTDNIEVLQSTGRCFNLYSVRAVEKWRYNPATINGTPTRRRGVETTIVFSIG